MAIICPLFSGSTGNSTYIACENTSILVDAGASFKGINEAINRIGGDVTSLSAIFVTHEHNDHIKGLKTLLKKSGATLVASKKTLETLINADNVPEGTKVSPINENGFLAGDIFTNRFSTSHDCEGSSGFTFTLPDGKKISVCTDLGIITDEVSNALKNSDAVLLESNHDIDMLKKGPYPPHLKVRILGDKGHISNNVCATEIKRLYTLGTNRFILGHLSLNNNTPLLARSAVEAALIDLNAENGKDYILKVASPSKNGALVL